VYHDVGGSGNGGNNNGGGNGGNNNGGGGTGNNSTGGGDNNGGGGGDNGGGNGGGNNNGGGGGGVIFHSGGGGGGGVSTIMNSAYFDTHPLAKFQILTTGFNDGSGQPVMQAKVGQQLVIAGSFINQQPTAQNYVFIVQAVDQNGVATDLKYQLGTAQSGETVSVTNSWTPLETGMYTINVFIWDGISDAPSPLSAGQNLFMAVTN
jgi:hypothetical protein